MTRAHSGYEQLPVGGCMGVCYRHNGCIPLLTGPTIPKGFGVVKM